uniref:Uncharacterized protein n=1 Tax=Cajanus cajan TaxID=3821 RepID=A0A151RA00_CAJCA|nr:hypothetical protein KK1_039346 [Cajanus cajan]
MSRALHAHHRHQQGYHKDWNRWSSSCLIQIGSDPPASCWLGPQPLKSRHVSAAPSLCTTRVHPVYLQHLNQCARIDLNLVESRPSNSSSTLITSLILPHNLQKFPHLSITQEQLHPQEYSATMILHYNSHYHNDQSTSTNTKLLMISN